MRSAKYLAMLFVFCSATARAAVLHPATCGSTDVGAAVASASDGDTIVIPAGRCTWTTNLTITDKILTIQGAGIDQTTIVDGLSKDGFSNIAQLLIWQTKGGGVTRLTGITFGPPSDSRKGHLNPGSP